MNLGIVGKVTRKIIDFGVANSSTILTVCAVGGVIGTAVAASEAVLEARDTVTAHEMDEGLKVEKHQEITLEDGSKDYDIKVYYRERTIWEKVKLTWKSFLLPAFLGSATIACIIESHHIDNKQKLALAAAYSMSEEAAKEFRNKVAETIGEKKTNKIENEIMQDKINANPLPDDDHIIHTQYGEQLMYDEWSGRYFRSGQNEVDKKVNMLNKRMITKRTKACVNDLYELLGIPEIPIGNEFGWRYDAEWEDGDVTVHYYPAMSSKGEPCIGVRINPELLHVRLG